VALGDRGELHALRQQLTDPRMRALKALMFVAGVAPALAGICVPLYLLSVVGDPGRSAGYIAASSAISYAVVGMSAPALGAFADRWNNHRRLLLGALLFAAMVLVTLAHAHEPVVVSALSVCLAVGGQWLSVLLNAIQLLEVSPEATNTFLAANQIPFYVGSLLALSLGVGITAATGSVANTLLFVAGLFAAGACILALHLMSPRANSFRAGP
jgi:MFS-type transporter involved in bile tolerance (Atg22 family)